MSKNEITSISQGFLKNVSEILEKAKQNAKTAVNLSMVYAYYEIGRMIVEEEQQGENRAAYGKQLLKELSAYLTSAFGKGYSMDNLKLMRRFYNVYSNDQIGAVALNSAAVLFSCTFFEAALMRFLMKPLETTAFIKK